MAIGAKSHASLLPKSLVSPALSLLWESPLLTKIFAPEMDSVSRSAAPATMGAIMGVSVKSCTSGVKWAGVRVWKEGFGGI